MSLSFYYRAVSSSRNYGDPHKKGYFLFFFNLSFCKVGFSDLSDQTWNTLIVNSGRKSLYSDSDLEQPNKTELPLIFKHVHSSSCKSLVMYN